MRAIGVGSAWLLFKYNPPYFPWSWFKCWGKEHQMGIIAAVGDWPAISSPVPIPCYQCGRWFGLAQASWDLGVVTQVKYLAMRVKDASIPGG